MAVVFGASEQMDRAYRDAIVEVSDNVNTTLRDGVYQTAQDAIEGEIFEFMNWWDNAYVVYGYLLGTEQCFTSDEARNEFFNDVYENLGF